MSGVLTEMEDDSIGKNVEEEHSAILTYGFCLNKLNDSRLHEKDVSWQCEHGDE